MGLLQRAPWSPYHLPLIISLWAMTANRQAAVETVQIQNILKKVQMYLRFLATQKITTRVAGRYYSVVLSFLIAPLELNKVVAEP